MANWCVFCVLNYLATNTCMAHQCFDPSLTLQGSLVGQKLEELSLNTLTSLGPLDCYRNCQRYSLCQAVNFNSVSHQCELLSEADGNFVTNLTYNFIDVRSWTLDLPGNCSQHNCPNNSYCKEVVTGFECVPFGCMGVPSLENVNTTSFTSKRLWNFNESFLYVCNRGYYPSQNVFCESTGNLTTFICLRFESCSQIKECNPSAEPGDYTLYSPKIAAWLKIFCFQMLKAFVTLVHDNFAVFPPITRSSINCQHIMFDPNTNGAGKTTFNRVRYHITQGRLKPNFGSFHATNYSRQEYASAGDCYAKDNTSQCGVLGRFRIDLRDTGLRIVPNTTWELYGNDSVVYVNKSYEDQVVDGYCGGNCGGCRVGEFIMVEAYPYYVPQMELAFSCMNLTN